MSLEGGAHKCCAEASIYRYIYIKKQCFKHRDVIELCDGIILDFYTGLSHIILLFRNRPAATPPPPPLRSIVAKRAGNVYGVVAQVDNCLSQHNHKHQTSNTPEVSPKTTGYHGSTLPSRSYGYWYVVKSLLFQLKPMPPAVYKNHIQ